MPTTTETTTTKGDASTGKVMRIPLTLTTTGVRVHGAACVKRMTAKTSQRNTAYLDVVVGHAEGSTTLKVWSDDLPRWEHVREGAAVVLTLESTKGWRAGTFEWSLQDVALLPDDHPIRDDLLPACPISEAELTARWDALEARLTPAGRTLLGVVLDHVGRENYARMAAAEAMHHACVGGLRWHSIEVAEFALALATTTPQYAPLIDLDCLIVGALLHDVGKMTEMAVDRGIGIRRAPTGWARYHTTLGPEIVAVACALGAARLDAANVSPVHIAHLKHTCESHHGADRLHGSPTPPRSLEAWLIHGADLTSARLRQLTDDMTGLVATNEGWCFASGGRGTPVFAPGHRGGTVLSNDSQTTDDTAGHGAKSLDVLAPHPLVQGRTLHLLLLRDIATAVPLPTASEEA